MDEDDDLPVKASNGKYNDLSDEESEEPMPKKKSTVGSKAKVASTKPAAKTKPAAAKKGKALV
jgi:hypothetical protein